MPFARIISLGGGRNFQTIDDSGSVVCAIQWHDMADLPMPLT